VLFLPALWMAVGSIGESWLAGLGAVYLIGRFVYLRAYVAQPARRSLGFILTALPTLALLIIDLVVALRTLAAR
jgi:glutathione S-transferase